MKILEINQKSVIYQYYFYFGVDTFTIEYRRNGKTIHKETVKLNLINDEETLRVFYLFSEYAEEIWLNAPTKQRVTFMRNLLIYMLSRLNNIPVYKILKTVRIYIDGNEVNRSINSIVKNIYNNASAYEEIMRLLLRHSPKII